MLGCLPLAAMTVWSFAALWAGQSPEAPADPPRHGDASADWAESVRGRTSADVQALAELQTADWFAGEPLAALERLPESSPLRDLAEAWTEWNEAHRLVVSLLDADRGLETEDLPRLESAADELKALRKQYAADPPRGSGPLLRVLDERIEDLQARIDRLKRRNEATMLLASAREHFQRKRYASCVEACDRILREFSALFPPDTLSKVRVLRTRSAFWTAASELQNSLREERSDEEHCRSLEKFLAAYEDDDTLASSQRDFLSWVRGELARIESRMAQRRREKAGAEQIVQFRDTLPEAFVDRVRRAAQIAEDYPTRKVRETLWSEAFMWLTENLPQKSLEESPQLQEVETADGEILRGFFEEVRPDGESLYGYRRYASLGEMRNPTAAVGTLRAAQLKGPPHESVLRRAVQRYRAARERLLDEPHRREHWQAMHVVCQALEDELQAYRVKPGASQEPLSFEAECEFVARVLESPAVDSLATLRQG
jgi:hypothetical protein